MAQITFDLRDVAGLVVLVVPTHQGLSSATGQLAFDFDAGGSLQGIEGLGFDGAGCTDLPGLLPLVVAVADLALVGQGDACQSAFLVVIALLAAIRVLVAL